MRWHSSFCKLSYLVVMLLALSYRHLTSPLLTWDGWCDWKSRYRSVCGLPVYRDIQAAIFSLLEQGVKKGEASILLHFYSEHDGWSHTVEVAQESFHCALLNNAAGVSSTHSNMLLWEQVRLKLSCDAHRRLHCGRVLLLHCKGNLGFVKLCQVLLQGQ